MGDVTKGVMVTDQSGPEQEVAEIARRLRLVSRSQWTELFAATARLLAAGPGEPNPLNQGSNSATGATTFVMPFIIASDELQQWERYIEHIGLIVPFQSTDWVAGRKVHDIEIESDIDAVRLISSIFRAARFVEGLIEGCVSNGTIARIISKLQESHPLAFEKGEQL